MLTADTLLDDGAGIRHLMTSHRPQWLINHTGPEDDTVVLLPDPSYEGVVWECVNNKRIRGKEVRLVTIR
jgi:hypothetical protein